jgi:hypothetical protein
MNPEKINSQLETEYKKYLTTIKSTEKTEIVNYDNHSLPLFMSVSQEYLNSKTRILFVGKETNGWLDRLSNVQGYNVEKIIKEYKFDKMKWNTPFWHFVKNTCEDLNILCDKTKSKYGFMWTNISKMDVNKKSPEFVNGKHQFYGFNLLEKEIKILDPHIVIFLTSKGYDKLIEFAIPGIFFEAYKGTPFQYLAKANFDNQIFYRTYHPRFLNSPKAKYNIKEVVGLLIGDFKQKEINRQIIINV